MAVSTLTSNRIGILPNGPHSGLHHTPVRSGPEKASSTFKRGAPLINSSGYLAIGTADMTSGLVGFALEDAHNDGSDGAHDILYTPAFAHVAFEATLEDETNVDHVLVAANRFNKYSLQVDSGGIWYLDENDTGNGMGTIFAFKDPIGTTRARVFFTVDISQTIYG